MRPPPVNKGPVPRARNVVQSFQFAGRGLVWALRTQRNLRIHFLLAILVLVLASVVQLPRQALAALALTIVVVLVAELLNTAVEAATDLLSPRYDEIARIAKNVAAGAVLVSAVGAVGIGVLLFYEPLLAALASGGRLGARSSSYLALTGLGLTLLLAWAAKTWLNRPPRLVGGMPSGHAAVAAALATAVYATSSNPSVTLLAVLLAGLVAESRVEAGLHSVWEVAAGLALGVGVMGAVFVLLG